MRRTWRGVDYWLTQQDSFRFSLLSYKTQDHHRRSSQPIIGWAVLYQSLTKKKKKSTGLSVARPYECIFSTGDPSSDDCRLTVSIISIYTTSVHM